MRILFVYLATLWGVGANGQTGTTDELPTYDYDTTLAGGYSISFKVDDSLQYLFLKKNGKTIAELASTSKGLPYKNLGYVSADFMDYFVLTQSFGSGNPHYIELIKKATGQNILESGAAWIDADKKYQYLLYSKSDVPNQQDRMILFNIRTSKKQLFEFPKDIFQEPQVLNRIQIETLTDKELVIRYETEKGSKTKKYNRHL